MGRVWWWWAWCAGIWWMPGVMHRTAWTSGCRTSPPLFPRSLSSPFPPAPGPRPACPRRPKLRHPPCPPAHCLPPAPGFCVPPPTCCPARVPYPAPCPPHRRPCPGPFHASAPLPLCRLHLCPYCALAPLRRCEHPCPSLVSFPPRCCPPAPPPATFRQSPSVPCPVPGRFAPRPVGSPSPPCPPAPSRPAWTA